VWEIRLPDGTCELEVWAKDAKLEEVYGAVKQRHKHFRIRSVGVGSWKVTGISEAYFYDGRAVDERFEVVLT